MGILKYQARPNYIICTYDIDESNLNTEIKLIGDNIENETREKLSFFVKEGYNRIEIEEKYIPSKIGELEIIIKCKEELKNVRNLFQNCSFTTIDFENFDYSKIEESNGIFIGCVGKKENYLNLSCDELLKEIPSEVEQNLNDDRINSESFFQNKDFIIINKNNDNNNLNIQDKEQQIPSPNNENLNNVDASNTELLYLKTINNN